MHQNQVLEATWTRLEGLLGRLGGILKPLGGILGASWKYVGASWAILEASWRRLGAQKSMASVDLAPGGGGAGATPEGYPEGLGY